MLRQQFHNRFQYLRHIGFQQCRNRNHLHRFQGLFPKAYLQLRTDGSDPAIFWVEYASREQVMEQMARARDQSRQSMTVKGLNSPVHFFNLFLTFYWLFIALMVISPIPLWEKVGKLLIGTVLFYFYTVFKIWLQLMSTFNQPEIAIYSTGEGALRIIRACLSGLTLGANILVVLVLWVALVFNRDNWAAFLEKAGWKRES